MSGATGREFRPVHATGTPIIRPKEHHCLGAHCDCDSATFDDAQFWWDSDESGEVQEWHP